MWPNPQETADLASFTEEILNGKLHFLCSIAKSGDNQNNGNTTLFKYILFSKTTPITEPPRYTTHHWHTLLY